MDAVKAVFLCVCERSTEKLVGHLEKNTVFFWVNRLTQKLY